jgi:hypothetical protein
VERAQFPKQNRLRLHRIKFQNIPRRKRLAD